MSELIVSRQQRVLLLTLNRPAARNALNNALLTQLVNELEAAATDSSISVCVITGNARFLQIAEQLEAAAADAEIAVCVMYGNERCFAAGADPTKWRRKTCLPP